MTPIMDRLVSYRLTLIWCSFIAYTIGVHQYFEAIR